MEFVNASFVAGLSGWTTEGDVIVSSESALIGDGLTPPGALFQVLETGAGAFILSFEFANSISDSIAPGAFSDLGLATLYLGDVPFTSVSDAGSYTAFVALFDIDAEGIFNSHPNAAVTEVVGRSGWSQFSLDFETPYLYATPYFQLFEQNGAAGDSVLALDDFAVVPEPKADALLLSVFSFVLLRRFLAPRKKTDFQ